MSYKLIVVALMLSVRQQENLLGTLQRFTFVESGLTWNRKLKTELIKQKLQVARATDIMLNVLLCCVVAGQFYSGFVPCISHRSTVFTDSKPCAVPGDFQASAAGLWRFFVVLVISSCIYEKTVFLSSAFDSFYFEGRH